MFQLTTRLAQKWLGTQRGRKVLHFTTEAPRGFAKVLSKLFRRKTRTQLGFSFLSALLWAAAPELAAIPLSVMARGTVTLPSSLAYPVSALSCAVTNLS